MSAAPPKWGFTDTVVLPGFCEFFFLFVIQVEVEIFSSAPVSKISHVPCSSCLDYTEETGFLQS